MNINLRFVTLDDKEFCQRVHHLAYHDVIVVNRWHKWDTFKTKINGHIGACSCFLGEVNYHRKEQAIDSRNIRKVLAS